MANDIATLAELRSRSGLALAAGTGAGDAAGTVLDGLAGALEQWADKPLAEETVAGERHVDHPGGNLYLRRTPVQSVTELRRVSSSDGSTTVVSATLYEVTAWGVSGAPAGTLEVDYVAGPAPTDAIARAAKHIVLEAANRVVKRMDGDDDGLESIRQEGYALAFVTEAFTESELALIPRRKRVRG